MAKHEKSFVDFDKPYEQNIVGMRGIVIFGIGLFFLIVITFALMWVLMNVMENDAKETKASKNPMRLENKEDYLPPEPRLQAAPGFKVTSGRGDINLELREPQAEYREIRKLWETAWKEGQKDPQTGTVIALPIDEAKKRFLEQSAQKAQPNEEARKTLEQSRRLTSYSSAGRTMSDTVR